MKPLISDEWTMKHLEQAKVSTGCLVLGLIGTEIPELKANKDRLEKAARRADRALSKYIEILQKHQKRKAKEPKHEPA